MQYKTIMLGLIEQRPRLLARLKRTRTALTALDHYSADLKASHEVWKETLSRTRPGGEAQIASEALELALKDMEDRLDSEYPPEPDDMAETDPSTAP